MDELKVGDRVEVKYPDGQVIQDAEVKSIIFPTVHVSFPHPDTGVPWMDIVKLDQLTRSASDVRS